ncbi:hypothetical protein IW245_002415 [Longispora fulva]|uniref:Uncharacterized protein n=1 Tax=Longispora fulva TaxID=619741 RepID=A0A8J7KK39_9ACTN|nr:hypothetical protein [Longispora fulva]
MQASTDPGQGLDVVAGPPRVGAVGEAVSHHRELQVPLGAEQGVDPVVVPLGLAQKQTQRRRYPPGGLGHHAPAEHVEVAGGQVEELLAGRGKRQRDDVTDPDFRHLDSLPSRAGHAPAPHKYAIAPIRQKTGLFAGNRRRRGLREGSGKFPCFHTSAARVFLRTLAFSFCCLPRKDGEHVRPTRRPHQQPLPAVPGPASVCRARRSRCEPLAGRRGTQPTHPPQEPPDGVSAAQDMIKCVCGLSREVSQGLYRPAVDVDNRVTNGRHRTRPLVGLSEQGQAAHTLPEPSVAHRRRPIGWCQLWCATRSRA